MPTDVEKTNIVYKARFGVADTESTRKIYEEPIKTKSIVCSYQIYANDIPMVNPLNPDFSDPDGTTLNYVQVKKNVTLTLVSGTTATFYSPLLIDAIPFNMDKDGGTYNYKLTKSDGVTQIYFGINDWIVDPGAGTLRFYGGLPSGVSGGFPPKINYFRYVGARGVSSGFINSIINVGGGHGVGLFKNLTAGGTTANFYNINSVNPSLTITLDSINNKYDFAIVPGQISHADIGNLTTSDDHTQYVRNFGRGTGQTIFGGTSANENLTLVSNTSGTPGAIITPDKIRLSHNNAYTYNYANKRILGSTGITNIFTITLTNTGQQYVTMNINISVFNTSNNAIENFIATLNINNVLPAGLIERNMILETISSNNFGLVDGTNDNTFSITYPATGFEIVVYTVDYIVNGHNHAVDVLSIS
jgi:hypothetical protein